MRIIKKKEENFTRILYEWSCVELSIHKSSDTICWIKVGDFDKGYYNLIAYPYAAQLKEKFNHLY